MGLAVAALSSACQSEAGRFTLDYAEIAHFLDGQGAAIVAEPGADARFGPSADVSLKLANMSGHRSPALEWRLPLPEIAIPALGRRYAIKPGGPITVFVRARQGDARLIVEMQAEHLARLELICQRGPCREHVTGYSLFWRDPGITLVLAPRESPSAGRQQASVRSAASRPAANLDVHQLIVSGRFELDCQHGWGLANLICAAADTFVTPQLGALVGRAVEIWRRSANERGLHNLLNEALRASRHPAEASARLGRQPPSISIQEVSADAQGVRVSFCLGRHCQ